MNSTTTELGKMLRKLRIDREETLGDMAERLGCTSSYLSAIEKLNYRKGAEAAVRIIERLEPRLFGMPDTLHIALQTDAAGLDRAAAGYRQIYPIAARCGVFAKSDIQPLINEGATTADLAASIFQAVVNQTISGLACGKPIRGCVAFLGGPLHFLPELKKAFIRTLRLKEEEIVDPEDAHLFAARGAALETAAEEPADMDALIARLDAGVEMAYELKRLQPLFRDETEYGAFRARHGKAVVKKADLSKYRGGAFLGIDAGSTTTKLALIGEGGELLFSYYAGNRGNPVKTAMSAIEELRAQLPEGVRILRSCSTGYGEGFGNHCPLHGGGLFRPCRGLRSGYRRAGYEVHQAEERLGRHGSAERGVLFRMRFVY